MDLVRPFVGLAALGLVAVGVSGVVAEVMGHLRVPAFMAGDLTGTTYTSSRCGDFVQMFPGRTCLEAAAMDHWGEVVQFRILAGIRGLIALLAYRQLRGSATPLPRGIVSGVALAAFGLACALSAWLSIVLTDRPRQRPGDATQPGRRLARDGGALRRAAQIRSGRSEVGSPRSSIARTVITSWPTGMTGGT